LQGVLITIFLFQANIDADIFHHWVVQDLLLKVPAGSVIVMDNASFHKRDDIRQSIEKAGCILEFLPTYSPDLNPIEHKWAQLKSIRSKNRCSIEEIFAF
jgi:transposase